MWRKFRAMIVVLVGISTGTPGVWSDEPGAAAKQASAYEAYVSTQKQWDKLEREVRGIIDQFRRAKPEEREPLRAKYEQLVQGGPALLKDLRATALEAFREAPNKHDDVVETMVRLVADDVRQDDYDAALELANQLIQLGCKNASLMNFAGIAAYCTDDFEHAAQWLKIAAAEQKITSEGSQCLADATGAKERFKRELKVRADEAAADDLPRVVLTTKYGDIVIELFENEAPETVANFVSLVDAKYYDGLTFHRVLPNFMAQGGCPLGTGTGGPGYKIFCETDKPARRDHFRGTLSMAHAGKNTGGSQFFITFRPTPNLDGLHTAFGRVVSGFEVLAKIQRVDPSFPRGEVPDKILKATVIRKRDHAYQPHKVQ